MSKKPPPSKRTVDKVAASKSAAETLLEKIRARSEAEATPASTPLPVPAPLTDAERETVAAWRAKRDARSVPTAVPAGGGKQIAFKEAHALAEVRLTATVGVLDPELAQTFLGQVVMTLPNTGQHVADKVNLALAALHELAPRDGVEAMLTSQMVSTHTLAMGFLAKAAEAPNPDLSAKHIEQATKLQRTYLAQVEALNRHRGKGQQRVTVEHVHVHDGGQAIVGQVATPQRTSGQAG